MKTGSRAFILALLLLDFPAHSANLFVGKILDQNGSHSNQSIDVLKTKDLTGTQDSWSRYIEFFSQNAKYQGIFQIPTANQILGSELTISVNYRGPEKIIQTWTMEILNVKNNSWQILFDNTGAKPWTWFMLSKKISTPSAYINSGFIQLRYRSNNLSDNSLLDYLVVSTGTTTTAPPPPVKAITPFPHSSSLFLQLQGNVRSDSQTQAQDLDLEDNEKNGMIPLLKSQGKKVICYFSAGTYENWRSDSKSFLASDLGSPLGDWPGEKWLNIRSANVRNIMTKRMDRAVAAGCNAIDPDNLDGYQNSNGIGLTEADQLNYLNWISSTAHAKGLAIGLKNAVDLIQKGSLATRFDFTINEECYSYNECSALKPFIAAGKAVFVLQYKSSDSKYCSSANASGYYMALYSLALDGKTFSPCK